MNTGLLLGLMPLTLLSLTAHASAQADLGGINSYLLDKTDTLVAETAALEALSDRYYVLAQDANFDYDALWQEHAAEVSAIVTSAREAWTAASPLYEQVEGIVAGTPSLAQFDVDLDAGASAAEDPQNAVSFGITLPDGRVLERPGNLFGVTESTLWGTFESFSSGVKADLSGDGQFLGLGLLGFTSVYREGFETALFLQALVLEAGTISILAGVALGLAATFVVGFVVFKVQTKLPYKKMPVITAVMLGGVLLVMVGNTAHALQVVGWLPTHPLRFAEFPYRAGLWFGLYATWEGVVLQAVSGVFVVGGYALAERLKARKRRVPRAPRAAPETLRTATER